MNSEDIAIIGAGALAWAAAVPAVKIVGNATAEHSNHTNKAIALVFGVGLAYATTPLLSYLMGWKTQYARVRGIALALGTAQTIDGIIHIFYPAFYAANSRAALAAAGNIFYGAGLLGIFSAYA